MELIDLTAENWRDAIAMEVKESQNNFIASNVMTIAQSKFMPELVVQAMGAHDEMVGFVAYIIRAGDLEPRYENSAYIMRFMIDKKHQGKGHGRTLLELTVNAIKETEPEIRHIYLSVIPENEGAVGYYKKVGFVNTGRVVYKEDEYRLDI